MNEERGSTQASPAQNVSLQQSAGQTSAVNAGFDASKLGGAKNKKSEKPKKIKKPKAEKTKSLNNDGSIQKSKRPLWFWLVLGILGIAILGVAIWAIVKLVNSGEGKKTELPTEITLVDDGNDNNAVEDYLNQLRMISGSDGADSTTDTGRSIDDARRAASSAIAATDSEKQENAIRAAEAVLLFQNDKYTEVIKLNEQINPNALSAKEKSLLYSVVKSSYSALGDLAMMNKYSQLEFDVDLELCQDSTEGTDDACYQD